MDLGGGDERTITIFLSSRPSCVVVREGGQETCTSWGMLQKQWQQMERGRRESLANRTMRSQQYAETARSKEMVVLSGRGDKED